MDLREAAKLYIYDHFLSVTQEDEFTYLPKDVLVKFLHSENLHVKNEFDVFQAAMNWILKDTTVRRKLVFEVMAPVRFPIISQKLLEKYIEDCNDLSLKIALRKLVQDFRRDKKIPLEVKFGRIKPYLLQPRQCARKNIYVIGGYTREKGGRWSDSQSLNKVEYFNSFNQMWKEAPSMRQARSSHGVAVLNGNIYIIGGESDSLIYDNMECFDPSTKKWSYAPSMTVARCGLGVCVIEDCIYAVGGWVGSQIGDTVEKFDPLLGHWVVVGKVPTLRFAMGITAHNSELTSYCSLLYKKNSIH